MSSKTINDKHFRVYMIPIHSVLFSPSPFETETLAFLNHWCFLGLMFLRVQFVFVFRKNINERFNLLSKSHLPRNDFTSTSILFHVWSRAKGATTHIPQEKISSAHNMADDAPTFLFYINSLRINTGVCAAAKLGRFQVYYVNFQKGNLIIF